MQEGPPVASAAMNDPSVAAAAAGLLAQRILAGDRSAEDELVSTYRRGVFVIAVARTRDRDAANDLTQEILIAILKALRDGQLREATKLAAFIQGTARNLINNYLRCKAHHTESNWTRRHSSDPVEELESLERQRLVRRTRIFQYTDQQILLLSLVERAFPGRSGAKVELISRCRPRPEVPQSRRSPKVRPRVTNLRSPAT
jgi:DNA-directed RNA polymerase specialized sigma24 family protein